MVKHSINLPTSNSQLARESRSKNEVGRGVNELVDTPFTLLFDRLPLGSWSWEVGVDVKAFS